MNTFLFWFQYFYQYRDSCRLIIRKIQYAPKKLAAGPKVDLNKQFMTADKPIHLEASMEKEVQCFKCLLLIIYEIVCSSMSLHSRLISHPSALLSWRSHSYQSESE